MEGRQSRQGRLLSPYSLPFSAESNGVPRELAEHSSMADRVSVPHGIRLVRPAPGLEQFVRYYAQRDAHIGDAVVVHPVHARAAPLLEFIFGDSVVFTRSDGKPPRTSPQSVVVGMQTHRRGVLHIRGRQDSFAILFQPAGLDSLFALPSQEFTDQDFDAEAVFGPMIARFQEQLVDCSTLEERVSITNRFLLPYAAAGALDGVSTAANHIPPRGRLDVHLDPCRSHGPEPSPVRAPIPAAGWNEPQAVHAHRAV